MVTLLGEEYLTVPEAAAALHVAKSTIRRWMAQGTLPSYRVGQRRVVVKRVDVAGLIMPARRETEDRGAMDHAKIDSIRPLTPEERMRGLAAMAEARRLREDLVNQRGGEPFPPSWEDLAEFRDERSRQLE
jgi:excisionase family DNA binding protein